MEDQKSNYCPLGYFIRIAAADNENINCPSQLINKKIPV